jgi:drug/metabolite transporter (DMT)-like permease
LSNCRVLSFYRRSGIWNKELVGGLSGVSPTVLTLLHLIVSLLSDVAVMRYSKEGVPQFPPMHGRHSTWDIFRCFLPVAVFVTLSKLTTYMSYQHVSVSLSHTAKASEPIWNVIVAALVFGEFYTQPVYLSLVPIAFGVALASVTDFTYNHTGFFWAVVSAIM